MKCHVAQRAPLLNRKRALPAAQRADRRCAHFNNRPPHGPAVYLRAESGTSWPAPRQPAELRSEGHHASQGLTFASTGTGTSTAYRGRLYRGSLTAPASRQLPLRSC
jgi:hypothetical protein